MGELVPVLAPVLAPDERELASETASRYLKEYKISTYISGGTDG